MPVWRKFMISLAASDRVTVFMQRNGYLSKLATRFVGGPDVLAGVAAAAGLRARDYRSSLFFLGEYVADAELVRENVRQKMDVASELGSAGLDVHVSIDPTQVGYLIGDDLGRRNALEIGRIIAEQPVGGRNLLMLDMEDFSYVDKTLISTPTSRPGA